AIDHGEGLGEGLAVGLMEPLRVIGLRHHRRLMHRDEIANHIDDELRWQSPHVALDRMSDAVAVPVIVDLELRLLMLAGDVAGEEIADALVLGERDVAALVEDEALVIAEGPGMAA